MPTKTKKRSKSVLKRQRQIAKRTARNRSVKSELRTRMRRLKEALAAGDLQTAKERMAILASRLDKAVKRGIIHPNNAANKKSKAMARLNKALQAAAKKG